MNLAMASKLAAAGRCHDAEWLWMQADSYIHDMERFSNVSIDDFYRKSRSVKNAIERCEEIHGRLPPDDWDE